MDELERALEAVMAANPLRITLSAPRPGGELRRAKVRPLEQGWQVETFTATQAFHQNFPAGELAPALAELLRQAFTQLTATAADREISLRVSKKGRVLQNSRLLPGEERHDPATEPSAHAHDRAKKRPIAEGTDIPALYDMGIFTADGRVVAQMRDKYRQINRFVELVDDTLPGAPPPSLRVVDFGCGKSYLTFILYHYLVEIRGISAQVTGLDRRADVIEKSNAAAKKYGYAGLVFQQGDIANYQPDGPVDMVVALHACDTATDLALANALAWGAGIILSVPCCQHEVNSQMHSDELSLLTRYGIVRERAAALMTDAIRANLLAACGYKSQLLEFVSMDHTPKNIMLRAVRANLPDTRRKQALAEVERLCATFRLDPCLPRLLRERGILAG